MPAVSRGFLPFPCVSFCAVGFPVLSAHRIWRSTPQVRSPSPRRGMDHSHPLRRRAAPEGTHYRPSLCHAVRSRKGSHRADQSLAFQSPVFDPPEALLDKAGRTHPTDTPRVPTTQPPPPRASRGLRARQGVQSTLAAERMRPLTRASAVAGTLSNHRKKLRSGRLGPERLQPARADQFQPMALQ